jgi:alpha-ketoglutaric semialdehyde dehydrogenase
MTFTDNTPIEIEDIMQRSWNAFVKYRQVSLKERAAFMRAIAKEIGLIHDLLLDAAGRETNLPEARLRSEGSRTIFQLNSYADAAERGEWMDIRIDTADKKKTPAKPDLRKMLVPLGPVVVFGAANFPFAYSTAGGDTASAFAAGCTVVVKAHPAHAETSELVAGAILKAAIATGMPEGIFAHVHGESFEVGKALVEHPLTRAVGFTGSLAGGKQLFDWANQRKQPIPVFAEMSSINPIVVLPNGLTEIDTVVKSIAGSVTLGVGQFCTNPGLIIGISGPRLDSFVAKLSTEITTVAPGNMLNAGIFKNYVERRANALAQEGVSLEGVSDVEPQFNQGAPTVARTSADIFIANPLLHQEVFGPFTLVVGCNDLAQLKEVVSKLEGQLTTSLFASEEEVTANSDLLDLIIHTCGRFVFNAVPTGVEVCTAMHHGGPYPATTDSRFTSVGADAIKRFARPVAFQNWDDALLPQELKDSNPLKIWRTVNDEPTKHKV